MIYSHKNGFRPALVKYDQEHWKIWKWENIITITFRWKKDNQKHQFLIYLNSLIRTQNHLIRKRTQNHLAKLVKWSSDGWVFAYKLSGCGFEFRCRYLILKYPACFEQGIPWNSVNHRGQIRVLWIKYFKSSLSKTCSPGYSLALILIACLWR